MVDNFFFFFCLVLVLEKCGCFMQRVLLTGMFFLKKKLTKPWRHDAFVDFASRMHLFLSSVFWTSSLDIRHEQHLPTIATASRTSVKVLVAEVYSIYCSEHVNTKLELRSTNKPAFKQFQFTQFLDS